MKLNIEIINPNVFILFRIGFNVPFNTFQVISGRRHTCSNSVPALMTWDIHIRWLKWIWHVYPDFQSKPYFVFYYRFHIYSRVDMCWTKIPAIYLLQADRISVPSHKHRDRHMQSYGIPSHYSGNGSISFKEQRIKKKI